MMTYEAIADREYGMMTLEDTETVASFTARWSNGDEPAGSTIVRLMVQGADDAGYIILADDDQAGGRRDEAGQTVYATRLEAIEAAKAYAAEKDEA